jgi:mono/diheme cytochrome c family protein
LKIFRLTGVAGTLFFAFTAAASAQTPAPDANLTASPVFQKNCEKCHGKTAMGRHFAGPALASDKVAAASADDLRKIISDGKGHMPKFAAKLTSDEIHALVRQIQALNQK